MGTWGIRTFENDDATDWIDGFAGEPDPKRLRSALGPLNRESSGPDAPLPTEACSVALAAAEVVAAWCGRPAPELPPLVTAWLLGRTESVTADILQAAREAVETIRGDSQLRDLWSEAGDLTAWEGALEDLCTRLGGSDA